MLTGTNQQRCSVILFSLSSRYAAVNPMSRCNNESCRSYKIVRPYRSSCHLTSRSTVDDAAVAWSQIWLEQYQTTRLRLRLDSCTSAARISYTSHMIPWHGGATSNAIWRHQQLHTTHAPVTAQTVLILACTAPHWDYKSMAGRLENASAWAYTDGQLENIIPPATSIALHGLQQKVGTLRFATNRLTGTFI